MSLLKVNNLSATAENGAELKKISFCIEEKGVYGFFCKDPEILTLLARVLSGSQEADRGDVIYRDGALFESERTTARIKRRVGYVPRYSFFSNDATVGESLDFIGRAKKVNPDKRARQIKEALEITGLSGKNDILIGSLTSSEKKRVAYAGAMLGNPDVIIIDEPLASLDAASRDGIKKLIGILGGMKAVVLFSVNPTGADELCTHAAMLDSGRLLAFEQIDSLVKKINDKVSALLRVKERGAERKALLGELSAIEGVASATAGTTSGGITDIRIECATRDGMTSRISSAVESLGCEVVSLKFVSLGIGDVMASLRESKKEEV